MTYAAEHGTGQRRAMLGPGKRRSRLREHGAMARCKAGAFRTAAFRLRRVPQTRPGRRVRVPQTHPGRTKRARRPRSGRQDRARKTLGGPYNTLYRGRQRRRRSGASRAQVTLPKGIPTLVSQACPGRAEPNGCKRDRRLTAQADSVLSGRSPHEGERVLNAGSNFSD